ncbi:MAG: TerD family protein [Deltaproteobacteria bacterium]|jgi:stress response protein SCP2|nr:TerD family protein [Deltaproteobacteria bacterium]
MEFIKGNSLNIVDFAPDLEFEVKITLNYDSNTKTHICCLALDEEKHLLDSRYLIQPRNHNSPEGALVFEGSSNGLATFFKLNLKSLPQKAKAVVFVSSYARPIGQQVRVKLNYGAISLHRGPFESAVYVFSNFDYSQCQAVTISSIVLKDDRWVFSFDGRGFYSGLAGLFSHYGALDFLDLIPPALRTLSPRDVYKAPDSSFAGVCLSRPGSVSELLDEVNQNSRAFMVKPFRSLTIH